MLDPARPLAISRRRFLTLSAAAAAVPALAACGAVRAVPTGAGPVTAAGGTAELVDAVVRNGVRAQVDTPLGPDLGSLHGPWPGQDALAPVRADSLLVLSYHNVTADGRAHESGRRDRYTVSAADFASQIDMLRGTGFTSVRLDQVLAAMRGGRPLPPRPVLITFDDGGAGQWVYADRVLAAAGFSAVAFLITGHLGTSPSYLTWAEAAALAGSGRWDIGAHTHDHHYRVPTGRSGLYASVLINRVWDPGMGSLQPADAARRSFDRDLETSLTALQRAGISRPQAFAYPFSQVDAPTNDVGFAAYVRQRLATTFPLLMSNSAPARTARPEDLLTGMFPRVEVRPSMSTLNLFEQIRAADTNDGSGHIPGGRQGG